MDTRRALALLFSIVIWLILQPCNAEAQRTTILHKEQIEHAFIYVTGDNLFGVLRAVTSEIVAATFTTSASGMIGLPLHATAPIVVATPGRIIYVNNIDPIVAGIWYQNATQWVRIPDSSTIGSIISNNIIVDEQLSGDINGSNTVYNTSFQFDWETMEVSIRWHPDHEHNKLHRGTHYIQAGTDQIQMVTPITNIDPYRLIPLDIRLYASYITP